MNNRTKETMRCVRQGALVVLLSAVMLGGLAPRAAAPLAAAPLASASARSATDTNPGEMIAVHLRILGSYVDAGGTRGAVDMVGSADAAATVGEGSGMFVTFGGFDPDGRAWVDSCFNSLGGAKSFGSPEETKRSVLEKSPSVWWVDFRVLPAAIGQVSLEVKWDHLVSEVPGKPVSVRGDTRRIVMNEGESHLLDVFTFEKSRCTRDTTVLLEISAEVRESPALASESIAYDLWFKHTDDSGTVTTRRFQAVGRQGEMLDFRFAPMRFPVPGVVLTDGSGLDSILESSGGVRGRLRPDGTISLDVGVTRWIGAAAVGDPRTGGYGAGGRKQVTVAAGETVGMVLPSAAEGSRYGYDDRTGSAPAGRPPVVPVPPRVITVDSRQFYAGHKDELIITASRIR